MTSFKNHLLKLPPNAIQEIRKVHNLDQPGRIEEAINILEEWINKQDHILKKDFSRNYLERIIITTKGSLEKAKKRVDKLCTMRTLLPHFFTKTNLKSEMNAKRNNLMRIILTPKLTKDFYRIILLKMSDDVVTEKIFLEYFQYSLIFCEYILGHDYVDGFIGVIDLQQSNILELVTKSNPVTWKEYVTILIEGYGARMKGVYFLTNSKLVDMVMKVAKQVVSPKVANRLHVIKSLEELHMMVPKELLPIEYGGNQDSFDKLVVDWIEEVSTEEHVKYVEKMNKACTDEALRRPDYFLDDCMGMPGSFRKMTVD